MKNKKGFALIISLALVIAVVLDPSYHLTEITSVDVILSVEVPAT